MKTRKAKSNKQNKAKAFTPRHTKTKILYELVTLRLKNGATQMELVKELHVSPQTINIIYRKWIQSQVDELKSKQATITGVANIQPGQ